MSKQRKRQALYRQSQPVVPMTAYVQAGEWNPETRAEWRRRARAMKR